MRDPNLMRTDADDTGDVPGQLLTLGVPLLERAHELAGRNVVVWIAGGIRIDGRLVSVNDEQLVLVVEDDHDRYDVAIESIAALAVSR